MSPPPEQPPSYHFSTYPESSRRDSYISQAGSSRSVPSPQYSPTAGRTELVLDTQSLAEAPNASNHEYVYRCKNLEINLGPKLWGTSNPVYGTGGIVEGRAVLSGELTKISSIVLKLEGKVVTTFTERGMVSGAATNQIVSTSATMTPSAHGHWDSSLPFALPFPSYALGSTTRLPPSLITYQPGVTCEIKYSLKVTIVRKGLRRNDSLKVPVLYLPRTFAGGPSLLSIPEPVVDLSGPSLVSSNPDHVRVIQLQASWRKDSPCNAKARPPAVFLTLPSELSMASDDVIPLALSVISPFAPAVVKLLSTTVQIQLIKRTRLWVNNGRMGSKHDALLGNADVLRIDESSEGASTLMCELRSAHTSTTASWSVTNVAEQQYFIRVSVQPPASTAAHIPSFGFEQQIQLTTDSFDSSEQEILALGGMPSPAMEILAQPPPHATLYRQDSHISCATDSYLAHR